MAVESLVVYRLTEKRHFSLAHTVLHSCLEEDDMPDQKIETYLRAFIQSLDQRLRDALGNIDADRKLLALRNYLIKLHADPTVLAREWPMTQAEADAFRASAAGRTMRAEIDAIVRHFNPQNPGYTLGWADFRSLQKQVDRWNDNEDVGVQSGNFNKMVERELSRTAAPGWPEIPPYLETRQTPAQSGIRSVSSQTVIPPSSVTPAPTPVYSSPPSPASLEKFKLFLRNTKVTKPTSNATPGFSRHGRCRAVDFTIRRGDTKIAWQKTSTASEAWDRPGWTQRLTEAVQAGGPHFSGPLRVPGLYEPWHYTYK
jgi:hypothetical protein